MAKPKKKKAAKKAAKRRRNPIEVYAINPKDAGLQDGRRRGYGSGTAARESATPMAKKAKRSPKQIAAAKRNIKKAQAANRKKGGGGGKKRRASSGSRSSGSRTTRKKNPAGGGKKRKRRSTGGRMPIFGDLMPNAFDMGQGAGLLVADAGAYIAESKVLKPKKPGGALSVAAHILGALLVPRFVAKGVAMVPWAPAKRGAFGMYKVAKAAAMARFWREVLVPIAPKKAKDFLANWGLRGQPPVMPLNGYVVDGLNGTAWELNGVEAEPVGMLPSPTESVIDGLSDLSDEELEAVIDGADYYDDDEDDEFAWAS